MSIEERDSHARVILNVKDFGAVGDGVRDDGASVQRALDAAAAQHARLRVPNGSYRIGVPLTLRGGADVFGDSPKSTLLFAKLGAHYAFSAIAIQDVQLTMLTITGEFAFGFFGANGKRFTLRQCRVSGGTIAGPTGNLGGVHCSSVDGLVIEDCHFESNGHSDVASFDILINALGSASVGTRIARSQCLSGKVGVNLAVFDARDVVLEGNTCSGAATHTGDHDGYGILIYRTHSVTRDQVRDNVIQGNRVESVQGTGIYVQGSDHTQILRNVVHGAGSVQTDQTLPVGCIAHNGGHDSMIEGNTCDVSGKAAIVVSAGEPGVDGSVVRGNRCSDTVLPGIYLRGDVRTVVIESNHIRNCGGGIGNFVAAGVESVSILNNFVQGTTNSHAGVFLIGASRSTIRKNSVVDASGDGINVSGGVGNVISDNIVVDNSTLGDNKYSGLQIEGSTDVVVSNNRAGNTKATGTRYGIQVLASPGAVVTGNVARGNRTADYHIDSSPRIRSQDNKEAAAAGVLVRPTPTPEK